MLLTLFCAFNFVYTFVFFATSVGPWRPSRSGRKSYLAIIFIQCHPDYALPMQTQYWQTNKHIVAKIARSTPTFCRYQRNVFLMFNFASVSMTSFCQYKANFGRPAKPANHIDCLYLASIVENQLYANISYIYLPTLPG